MNDMLASKLQAVRVRFRQSLPERLREVSAELASAHPDMKRIHRILHDISGSAGLLGEGAVATAIAPAFAITETCARTGRMPNAAELQRMKDAVTWAGELLERSETPVPDAAPAG